MEVFIVQHLHTINEDEEDIKIIGIYSSREKAFAAITRLKTKSGFKDFHRLIDPSLDDQSDGFYIDKYELDKDDWSEGFFSV